MYTVIDTIHFRGKMLEYRPERLARGEGLTVILDPQQISERPDIPHNRVKILRPDNTRIELEVAEIEVHHNVVGLFFRDVTAEAVPRLSRISWG